MSENEYGAICLELCFELEVSMSSHKLQAQSEPQLQVLPQLQAQPQPQLQALPPAPGVVQAAGDAPVFLQMLRNYEKYEIESAIPAAAGATPAPRVVLAPTALPKRGDPHLRQAKIMVATLEESAVNYPQPQWVTSASVEKCKARLVAVII